MVAKMNAPTLITYTHTFNDKNEIIARHPNGLWYLPDGCTTYKDVPVGGCFTVILPDAWKSSVMEVTFSQVPKVDKEPCRYYKPREMRPLTADEIEVCKRLLIEG